MEKYDESFEVAVLPIIRRVAQSVDDLPVKFNPKELEDFYYENIEDCKKMAELSEYCKDDEAEALLYLYNKLVEKLRYNE